MAGVTVHLHNDERPPRASVMQGEDCRRWICCYPGNHVTLYVQGYDADAVAAARALAAVLMAAADEIEAAIRGEVEATAQTPVVVRHRGAPGQPDQYYTEVVDNPDNLAVVPSYRFAADPLLAYRWLNVEEARAGLRARGLDDNPYLDIIAAPSVTTTPAVTGVDPRD